MTEPQERKDKIDQHRILDSLAELIRTYSQDDCAALLLPTAIPVTQTPPRDSPMTEHRTYRIIKTPDTCRGAAHFEGTSLPVWILYGIYMQGGGDISPEARAAIAAHSYLPDSSIDDAVAHIRDNTAEIQQELLRAAALLSEVSSWMEVSDANMHISNDFRRMETDLLEERRKNKHLVDAIVALGAAISRLQEGDTP